MNKSSIVLFLATALVAACSSSTGSTVEPRILDGNESIVLPAGLRLDTGHGPKSKLADLQMTATAPPPPFFSYMGGPVTPQIEVVPILWGQHVSFADQLTPFYDAITKSEFVDWMSEYNTDSQQIVRGHACSSFTVPAEPPAIVDDAMARAELQSLIASGQVPPPNGEREYAIHLPPGVVSEIPLSPSFILKSCVHYCAYHLAFTDAATGAEAYYSVLPDQTDSVSCPRCVDPKLDGFQSTTQRASHQIASVITDPDSALFAEPNAPTGWLDLNTFNEIGDICEGQYDVVAGYTIQREWSNEAAACVARRTLAANDFNLLPDSPLMQMRANQTNTQSVLLTPTHGHAIAAHLSIGSLPAGLHATLDATTVRTNEAFHLTVTTDANVGVLSVAPITITASAPNTPEAGGFGNPVVNTTKVFVDVTP